MQTFINGALLLFATVIVHLTFVTTTSAVYDEWCAHCSSLEQCNSTFGQDHVDLRLRIVYPIDAGPGQHLMDKYFGNTIARQTFETQFILDIAASLDTSPCRLYVLNVYPEGRSSYWDSESVFVTFRLFPSDPDAVATLTRQTQEPGSVLYDGQVAQATDPLFGLVALQWDYSLKLMYSISIIGDSNDIDSDRGRYLNQGSSQSCLDPDRSDSKYCTFERHIVNDMEQSLGLQSGQFVVLFIKEADRHSVIVSFRLLPMTTDELSIGWTQSKVTILIEQISDDRSSLYSGNVMFKIDSTWGVSGVSQHQRQYSKYLSRPIPSTSDNAYKRCKATHRCPWGWSKYNQTSAESTHTFQRFNGGQHYEASLFLDFEDWKRGIHGWEQSCRRGSNKGQCLPAFESDAINKKIGGAHWSPFDFESLGPSTQAYGKRWNNGLVLNQKLLNDDIHNQATLVGEYVSLVRWLDDTYEYGITDDAALRSREEIRANITNYTSLILDEIQVLEGLEQSQCKKVDCNLLFNTSNMVLSGAVNAKGVISTTPDGTEVAVWAFDSIDLDENVGVTLTGQRAIALVSRSSARINTTFHAIPGTLGGFPGGFSVARRPGDRLERVCTEKSDSRGFLDKCSGKPCCPGDQPITELGNGVKSNNVNGPGSPSSRVYLFTIQTSAPTINEIQSLKTTADEGQTLSGGFRLNFNGYTSPFLRHDITARELKLKMEDSLNPAKPNKLNRIDRQNSPAGIGVVFVTRESVGTNGGYQWTVTFASTVGNVGEESSRLSATNLLVSKGANVTLETVQHGNSIGGMFALQFLGNETRLMNHDVSSSELEASLLQDIESITSITALRNVATDNCNDGFCLNGPNRSGGYTWTLTITTDEGNVSPYSPTSHYFDDEGEVEVMTAVNRLTGCVDSHCPVIRIDSSHAKSHNSEMQSILATKPFSLAYGGAGAGHGGKGGDGFAKISSGQPYGDAEIANLYGGSGGGVGVSEPFQLSMFKDPRGRGGSGGGAIEIIATNDIVIGSNAAVLCDGEAGSDGYLSAGGGGSGGSILLAAGGAVVVNGKLSVAGGAGGRMKAPNKKDSSFGGHGGAGSGGRIAIYGESVILQDSSNLLLSGGNCSSASGTRHCSGEGSLFVASALVAQLSLDHSVGTEGTQSSLFLHPSMHRLTRNTLKQLSSSHSGPEFDFGSAKQPSRISFYLRVEDSTNPGWDFSFELREARWAYLASKPSVDYTALVGIAVGSEIRHGVNYIGVPFDDDHIQHLDPIHKVVDSNVWTKVDLRFDWRNHLHDVYVNDTRVVRSKPFRGDSVRVISINNYFEGDGVWLDEVFVGEDTTMEFHCPIMLPNGTVQMDRPLERGWKPDDVGGHSSIRPLQRHESHISRRPLYQRQEDLFIAPLDGQGGNLFTSDIKFRSEDGDRVHQQGQYLAGSLLRLPRDESYRGDAFLSNKAKIAQRFGMQRDTFMWYGEHNHTDDPRRPSSVVMACSTQDFVTWRNEGIMLHYSNITDMVDGSNGPFHIEKPEVLYNELTQKYVMWMIIDNGTRELGMAGVATSDYANGPFDFIRSLYPDGNQTRDQTLFQDDDGTAYLLKTYYDTTDYVVPEAVMQPTWESVKNADGSINFALSYHRAEYDPGYDDYYDIYLQRWRAEDKPWKVICVNRLTGMEREVPYGKEHLNLDGEVCHNPFEYKLMLGQGNPMHEKSKDGIQSRFLDPNDPANNAWIPESVPGVKGQTWKANYEDGTCGKRMVNNDKHHFDPSLPLREAPNRGNCSNVVDNPIHPTLPDKRIGPEVVMEQRRSKYVAVSRLTDDYLDTSGVLMTFEGELEEGADLLSLVKQFGSKGAAPFGWSARDGEFKYPNPKSRIHDNHHFSQKIKDFDQHQYEQRLNDRSFYSPACVYDGQCPNNFT